MVMETSDVDGSNEQRKHVKLFQRSKTSLRRIMSRSSHTRVNSSDSLGSSVSSIRVRESSNSSSEDTQTTATTTTTAPRLVLRISVLRGRQLHAFEVNKVFLCIYVRVYVCICNSISDRIIFIWKRGCSSKTKTNLVARIPHPIHLLSFDVLDNNNVHMSSRNPVNQNTIVHLMYDSRVIGLEARVADYDFSYRVV